MEIKEFQDIIYRTYYEKDSQRGVLEAFRWLVEEVGELAKAIRKNDRENLIVEFSDVLAWLFSLANMLDIDMEEVAQRYAHGCPKCGNIPCTCGREPTIDELISGRED